RGIRNIRSGSMTESSENRQIVQKVKDEKILERGIQLIKGASMIRTAGSLMTLLFVHSIVIIFIQNTLFHVPINRAFDFALVNLLPRLNSSTYSFINNLPISDIISWNTSKINVEVLKLGATTLEFSMGWT
ncbi:10162_t:CDS:2, partial [Scutellospora calospora]